MSQSHLPSRRAFLRGIGGACLALPLLESVGHKSARASDGAPKYAFFMRQANGVTQADNGEPEQFWPTAAGPLTQQSLQAASGRVVSELAAYAPHLTIVKGLRFAFPGNGCGHSGGGNQCLTAARVSADPSGNRSLAMGESVDNYIARHQDRNGGEPLTLYTGPRGRYIEEVLSYRGALDLRPGENDPFNAYSRMVGNLENDALLALRRQSVNDLVRDQMQALLGRRDLSQADVRRLDLHFQAVRDFEVLSCRLAADEEQQMANLLGLGTLNDNRITVAQLHLDLIALAFSCDHVRAATLQVGDGNDSTQYRVNGQLLPRFHQISHRIYGDGDVGDPIVGAVGMHHDIDRIHARLFRHFLDRLQEHGILDRTVACWTNDLGAGVSHTYRNIPWVIAGSGGGFLRTGQYVELPETTHNAMLNTVISAVGLTASSGGPVTDFGDSSLTPGLIDAIVA